MVLDCQLHSERNECEKNERNSQIDVKDKKVPKLQGVVEVERGPHRKHNRQLPPIVMRGDIGWIAIVEVEENVGTEVANVYVEELVEDTTAEIW